MGAFVNQQEPVDMKTLRKPIAEGEIRSSVVKEDRQGQV